MAASPPYLSDFPTIYDLNNGDPLLKQVNNVINSNRFSLKKLSLKEKKELKYDTGELIQKLYKRKASFVQEGTRHLLYKSSIVELRKLYLSLEDMINYIENLIYYDHANQFIECLDEKEFLKRPDLLKYFPQEITHLIARKNSTAIEKLVTYIEGQPDGEKLKKNLPSISLPKVATFKYDEGFHYTDWKLFLTYQFCIKPFELDIKKKLFDYIFNKFTEKNIKGFAEAYKKLKPSVAQAVIRLLSELLPESISLDLGAKNTSKVIAFISQAERLFAELQLPLPEEYIEKVSQWMKYQTPETLATIVLLPNSPLKELVNACGSQPSFPDFITHRKEWVPELRDILAKEIHRLPAFESKVGRKNLRMLYGEVFNDKNLEKLLERHDICQVMDQVRKIKDLQHSQHFEDASEVPAHRKLDIHGVKADLEISDEPHLITDLVLGKGTFKVVRLNVGIETYSFYAHASVLSHDCENDLVYMKLLKDPQFIQIKTICHCFDTSIGRHIGLTMELCSITLSDLFSDLDSIRHSYDPSRHAILFDIFEHCFQALKILKDHKIIHRDLKGPNILIKFVNGIAQAKITDFGLAIKEEELLNDPSHTGTKDYIDPSFHLLQRMIKHVNYLKIKSARKIAQAANPQPKDGFFNKLFCIPTQIDIYSVSNVESPLRDALSSQIGTMLHAAKPDLWSLGFILYNILRHDQPYLPLNSHSQFELNELFSKAKPNSLEHLAYKLLHTDPNQRPTATEALEELREIRIQRPYFLTNDQ